MKDSTLDSEFSNYALRTRASTSGIVCIDASNTSLSSGTEMGDVDHRFEISDSGLINVADLDNISSNFNGAITLGISGNLTNVTECPTFEDFITVP